MGRGSLGAAEMLMQYELNTAGVKVNVTGINSQSGEMR